VAVAVFVPLAIAALLVFLVVLFVQRGRDGLELSSNTLFRAYLYVGSFAGVIVFAFGLAALLNAGLAYAAGGELVYGGTPVPARPAVFCPPGVVDCPQPPTAEAIAVQQAAELDRRRAEDLVRGLTFAVFGAAFWLVHWLARNRPAYGDQGPLQRAYFMLGTAVFGIATVVLLPMGLYQALSNWLVPRDPGFFRQGVGETLTAGVVSMVIWLMYLRLAAEGLRGSGGARVTYGGHGPSAPPPGARPLHPSGVGAPLSPQPGERSAGAEAQPPQEFRRDQFVPPAIVRVGRPGQKPRESG
jgi:hypothetical protein